MAKQIVILEKQQRSQFRVAFWLSVPTERQPFYADANKVSAYRDATTEELDALKAGQIFEHIDTIESRGQNAAQVRATLEEIHANLQAELNARDTWVRYGTSWDGAAWINAGVP